MYDINNMPQSIEIGYTGETNYRTIEIDMSKWLETMPEGYPSIVHICPGKTTADAYIANTTFADGILSWTISASDLGATEGTGLAQVWMEAVENYTLNKEGRSAVFATIVRQSLSDEDPTVPPSQLPWLEQMTLLKTQTLIASDEAKAAQTEATAAATTAESAAATAESAAETASGAATDASDYAGQALASKDDAEAAATAAAGSATDASGSASAAGDSATAAAGSATAAAGSATDALAYRNAASGYANTASEAATSSVGSASAAEAWATGGTGGTATATNNAKYYAEQAEETVSRYEGLTVEATTLEPGNEATAEITEVSGHMNIAFGLPQGEKGDQGERGYDGDKGMDGVSPEVTVTTITGGHRVAVTDAGGTSTFDVMDGAAGPEGPTGPAGQDGQDGYTPVRGTDYWTAEDKAEIVGDVEDDIIDDTAGDGDTDKTWSADKLSEETTFEKTLTRASIQSFEGGAWPMGMQIAIEPVQAGSGDPSPSNVRPITGWTGANVMVTGKNLLNGEMEDGALNATTGAPLVQENRARTKYYSPVIGGKTYIFSDNSTAVQYSSWMFQYDKDKNYIGRKQSDYGVITLDEETKYIKMYFDTVNQINLSNFHPQFQVGQVVSTYEPYSGITYPITFPNSAGTVYGGTLTVNADGAGTLVVDRGCDDLGDYSYTYDSTYTRFYTTAGISNLKSSSSPRTTVFICSRYKCVSDGKAITEVVNGEAYIGGGKVFVAHDNSTTDPSAFKATVTGQKIVYELATPVTYSLTPGQVLSILGQNNVWADCGDILSLTYNSKQGIEFIREDTAGQIAPVEAELADAEAAMAIVVDGDTAPKNITTGQYVFVKSHSTLATGMYHATTNIASGASVSGSNVAADANGIANVLTRKTASFTLGTISAGSYKIFTDSNAINKLIVGYYMSGVASKDVSILGVYSDADGIHVVARNVGDTDATPNALTVFYIG